MTAALYVCTAYEFNHQGRFGYKRWPLDKRFLDSSKDVRYFLIDEKRPAVLEGRPVLFEKKIDPDLATAGGRHLAEWSFLLAEAEHGFCEYPFFFVSSRFYQKNLLLRRDINEEWDKLFGYLRTYGWGYLPSYDRPLGWIDFKTNPLPVTDEGLDLIQRLFGVRIPENYRYFSDFPCNYIGFATRDHLLQYVNFYRPLFESMFDEHWRPIEDLSRYMRPTLGYRNEKPVTFLIEMLSHMFFYSRGLKFFGLHYDGYYEVDERATQLNKLEAWPALDTSTQMPRELIQPWIYRHRWSPARLLVDGWLGPRLRKAVRQSLMRLK